MIDISILHNFQFLKYHFWHTLCYFLLREILLATVSVELLPYSEGFMLQVNKLSSAVWVKKIPPAACGFLTFFDKWLRIFNQFFTHLLYVPIYARLQIFIQLSKILRKLCHIKRDYLVHVICSKCPPSAKTHAFRRLRKSLIALLIVICGKSSKIWCFYIVNKHAGYDMTSTVTSFAQYAKLQVKF